MNYLLKKTHLELLNFTLMLYVLYIKWNKTYEQ